MTTKLYAGFWRRFVAYFIDIVILGFFQYALIQFMSVTASVSFEKMSESMFALINIFVLNFTYFSFFWSKWEGQSPGKKLAGVRIVKTNRAKLDIKTAMVRAISYPLSALLFFIGFLWMGMDPKSQTWHDHIADTLVINTEDAPAALTLVLLGVTCAVAVVLLVYLPK